MNVNSHVRASKFSYDGEHFALVTADAKLLIYDLRSILDSKNNQLGDISPAICEFPKYHSEPINTIDWSLNGKLLATAGKDRLIKVNMLQNGASQLVS